MSKSITILLTVLVAFAAGCTLIPKYDQPKPAVPETWTAGVSSTVKTGGTAAVDIPWRDFFADKQLKKVIEQALTNNYDLRIAVLSVEKARALYGIQRSAVIPTVGVLASGDKSRLPGGIDEAEKDITTEQYSLSLGFVSYELDLFGRVRSLKAAALEQYLATEQARRSAQISLIAEVANVYLALAADRENLKLAQDTLKAQQETCSMIEKRCAVGASSELDLRQAQSRVEAARVDLARYTGFVAKDENALNLLVGSMVAKELLPEKLGAVPMFMDVAPGLPSEVLQRRPDILRAENQLKAANANIGAARAAYFPNIKLTAGMGYISSQLSGLFKSDSATWGFSPQIEMPIFAGGRIKAGVKVAKADRDIYLAQYQKAIQSAFREVADTLVQRETIVNQAKAQQALVDAVEAAYRLADARYQRGTDSYLTFLDVQRSLYGAQQALISLRLAKQANSLTLYKVLGGGAIGK